MPERFLLQILRSLVTHGILKSTRGVDGGYVLLREPSQVSLLDVIEAIEGPLTHEIAIGEGLPDSSREKLSDVLNDVTQAALDRLSSVKLSDLVCSPEEFEAMVAAREQAKREAELTTRIDAPTQVSQTPGAAPAYRPAPTAGTPHTGVPGAANVPHTPPTAPTTPTAPPNVIGSPDTLPGIHPNSGTSI